jgi:hypothetical protein
MNNPESGAPLQAAWAYFNEKMRMSREAVEANTRYTDNVRNRVAIFRSLAQVQAMAYNFAIAPSVNAPRIFVNTTYQTTLYTLGLACQDFFYGATYLDGRQRYRLIGRIGAEAWSAVQIQTALMGDPSARNLGEFELAKFADAHGAFDIPVGAHCDGTNGLPLDPACPYHFLWTRRVLRNWDDDHGELRIEALGPPSVDESSEAELARRIRTAADFAYFLVCNWGIGLYDSFLALAKERNTPAYLGGNAVWDRDVGSTQAYYGAFVYKIEDDEVLLIEGVLPQAAYWGIQLGDVWSNSLDFLNHQPDLNMARVAVDQDGRYRAIISKTDPGVANWLDCCGNAEGVGMIRVFAAREKPQLPIFKVLKAADLPRHLPAGTVRVTPAERAKAMLLRSQSLRRLYGE